MRLGFYLMLVLWTGAVFAEEVRKLPSGGAADLLNVTKFTPDGLPEEGARVKTRGEPKLPCKTDADHKDCDGTPVQPQP